MLAGDKEGNSVEIPRITLNTRDSKDFFVVVVVVLHRSHFPGRLAFTMTINKFQSQTLDKISLYND